MGLLDRVTAETKATLSLGGGQGFVQPPFWTSPTLDSLAVTPGEREGLANDFEAYVTQIYKADGPIAACIWARMFVFSEARFQWRRYNQGRPGDLFGDRRLRILERPWPRGTTGELLAQMEQDVSLAGNFYATVTNDRGQFGRQYSDSDGARIVRLRPDWVTLLVGSRSGSPYAIDARVIGVLYQPPMRGGYGGEEDAVILTYDQVCHYSPIPDPLARFRGMSWITPLIKDISADLAATEHKRAFFRNNATLQTVVSLDTEDPAKFEAFVRKFNATYRGASNAYKTLFVAGGADVNVVGSNLRELDFKATQGAGETRIASAAGVPPVWAGFSEGLQGSSLNAGNFGQARRRLADGTIRPLWRIAAASIDGALVDPPPGGASLYYDDRDIPFLREDVKDEAEVRQVQASAIASLVREGYTPESVAAWIDTGDPNVLEHSGLYSVQLQAIQAPGDNGVPPDIQAMADAASTNGNGAAAPTGGT